MSKDERSTEIIEQLKTNDNKTWEYVRELETQNTQLKLQNVGMVEALKSLKETGHDERDCMAPRFPCCCGTDFNNSVIDNILALSTPSKTEEVLRDVMVRLAATDDEGWTRCCDTLPDHDHHEGCPLVIARQHFPELLK